MPWKRVNYKKGDFNVTNISYETEQVMVLCNYYSILISKYIIVKEAVLSLTLHGTKS